VSELTHFDERGNAVMVDVSQKAVSARVATAEAKIVMAPATLQRILARDLAKGDVLTVAQLAGIMGAKRTPELIPLCHPLPLSKVTVELEPLVAESALRIRASCKVEAKTGVEMEALTAAAVAALTVYDMCKAIDRGMRIVDLRLLHKAGGRSGEWRAEE